MKACNRTFIALAIGAALASPTAFAQVVKGQADARIGAGVPNPVPAAQQAVDRAGDRAMQATDRAVDATTTAQERATDTATGAQERATDAAAAASDRVDSTAQNAQETTQSVPPAAPEQSQGSVNASAHASVTQRALWDKLDADRDGSISTAEADADADFGAGFATTDADGDGAVTQGEYAAYAKTSLATSTEHAAGRSQVAIDDLWRQYDADADGRLSAAEVEADADISGSFSAMDDDSDGFVTEAEYRTYAQANEKPAEPTP